MNYYLSVHHLTSRLFVDTINITTMIRDFFVAVISLIKALQRSAGLLLVLLVAG